MSKESTATLLLFKKAGEESDAVEDKILETDG